jgi:hypothetical protein
VIDDFLRFVVERHRIWEQRQAGAPQPWTHDPVLATRKFTNVFRVLDPGTQFLLKEMFDPDLSPRDTLMRAFLYRHTGRVETWEYLDVTTGYPTVATLREVQAAWHSYRGEVKVKTMMEKSHSYTNHKIERTKRESQRPFFTGAYLVFPQSDTPGTDKLDSIIDLTQRLFTPGSPQDIMPRWMHATSQAERFRLLRQNKGVGDFMAMQVLTDWGYQCGEDREDEFLVPGPGSIKGAKAIDPTAKPMDLVHRIVKEVQALPDCPTVGYRRPSLMDIGSNLLCEWSKYVRFRGQALPTKTYQPAHPGPQAPPVLPSYYSEDIL